MTLNRREESMCYASDIDAVCVTRIVQKISMMNLNEIYSVAVFAKGRKRHFSNRNICDDLAS